MAEGRNDDESLAYRQGYTDMMQMHDQAQRRGWSVPERLIVREILRLEHSALPPRTGTPVPTLGPRPYPADWYRGRAAALREILRAMRG